MSDESWGRSVERERDVGRSIVGRWSAERDRLWYSCLSMAPWFLQRLLKDRQQLSGTPAGRGSKLAGWPGGRAQESVAPSKLLHGVFMNYKNEFSMFSSINPLITLQLSQFITKVLHTALAAIHGYIIPPWEDWNMQHSELPAWLHIVRNSEQQWTCVLTVL